MAGCEHKSQGKIASLYSQPYISPLDYDTVKFSSKKEVLLAQPSDFNVYERYQQRNATARQELPPQQVDAGGMRMMNNALWIPERAVCCSYACAWRHIPLCRSKSVRSYAFRNQGVCGQTMMAKDDKVFVQNCLHCVATNPGDKLSRPLRIQLHATKPSEILYFDFLYIGLPRDGKY
jgi:hypothetical protein